MKGFTYHEPQSISEACSILASYAGGAHVLAGGTDLIPKMKYGTLQPGALVNVKRLGLTTIEDKGQTVSIGALATLTEVIDSPVIATRLSLVKEAASQIACVRVRNVATIGGNLCNASPSADMAPPLMVLGAKAQITGPQGDRVVPLEEFFTGPGQTALTPGELLTGLEIPLLPAQSAAFYLRQSLRRALDIAIVGAAVALNLDNAGICQSCRIALGAVAPTPIRARKAESVVIGQKLSGELIQEAAIAASSEARPITDVRGTAEYRRRIVSVLVQRALIRATEELSR